MKTYSWSSRSEEDTLHLGMELGRLAQPGDFIALVGDLGSGKTVLARGMARGLGISGHIPSPTFTLIREYKGRLPFYHFDLYRLEKPEEIEGLGYEDYFFGRGVVLVEWADRAAAYLPGDRLEVIFDCQAEGRRLKFAAFGARSEELLDALVAGFAAGSAG